MNKLYRITIVSLLVLLLLFNIVFLFAGDRLLSYLRVERELEDVQSIIDRSRESLADLEKDKFLDLEILTTNKYQNLKEFKMDLGEFSLPGDLLVPEPEKEENDASDDSEERGDGNKIEENEGPNFEIGNSNPFHAPF